jgi:hypothetical protein
MRTTMAKNIRRRVYTTKRLKELSSVLNNFASVVDHVADKLNGEPAIVYCGDAPSKAVKTMRLFTSNLAAHEEQTARRERDTARKAARPGKIRDEMTQMMTRLAKLEKELKKIDSF